MIKLPKKLSWRFDPDRFGLSADTPLGPVTVRRMDDQGLEVVAEFLRPIPQRYEGLKAAQAAAFQRLRFHALTLAGSS